MKKMGLFVFSLVLFLVVSLDILDTKCHRNPKDPYGWTHPLKTFKNLSWYPHLFSVSSLATAVYCKAHMSAWMRASSSLLEIYDRIIKPASSLWWYFAGGVYPEPWKWCADPTDLYCSLSRTTAKSFGRSFKVTSTQKKRMYHLVLYILLSILMYVFFFYSKQICTSYSSLVGL